MDILSDRDAMRRWTRARRAAGERVAFVPTMGYLHEGHLSLVRRARNLADHVVVSVYVNPTQFAPGEDLDVYPRDLEGDLSKLRAAGVAVAFTPGDLYARGEGGAPPHETWVTVEALSKPLCGASRPIFFRGVATVVTKLFHIVEPDVAVFGKKDYQQWRLIRRLVRDLDMGIEVVGAPLVREPDGLAMSSRNVRLSADERQRALSISRSLRQAQEAVDAGERRTGVLVAAARQAIEGAGGRVDYVDVRDPESLEPVETLTGMALMAIAAHFGSVRLIDNTELQVAPS